MSQSELRFTFIHLSIQKGFMMNILKKITPKIFLVKEFYMRSTTAIKIFLIKKPSKLPVYILSEFLWKIYMYWDFDFCPTAIRLCDANCCNAKMVLRNYHEDISFFQNKKYQGKTPVSTLYLTKSWRALPWF